MGTRFRSGRNCSGFGGAAAGIESVVSEGPSLWVSFVSRSAAPQQIEADSARIKTRQLCCLYFPWREDANPGTWFCTLKRSFPVIFSIFCVFYNFLTYSAYILYSAHFCILTFCIFCKSFIRSQWWMDGRRICFIRNPQKGFYGIFLVYTRYSVKGVPSLCEGCATWSYRPPASVWNRTASKNAVQAFRVPHLQCLADSNLPPNSWRSTPPAWVEDTAKSSGAGRKHNGMPVRVFGCSQML